MIRFFFKAKLKNIIDTMKLRRDMSREIFSHIFHHPLQGTFQPKMLRVRLAGEEEKSRTLNFSILDRLPFPEEIISKVNQKPILHPTVWGEIGTVRLLFWLLLFHLFQFLRSNRLCEFDHYLPVVNRTHEPYFAAIYIYIRIHIYIYIYSSKEAPPFPDDLPK